MQAAQQESESPNEAQGVVDKANEKPQADPAVEPELKPEPKTDVEAAPEPELAPATESPPAGEGKSAKDKAPESAPKDKKAQDDAKAAREKQEKEAKDRRSQVRKAVQIPAPEINKPPPKASTQPGVAKHDFAQGSQVNIFENNAKLQSSPDFFDLNPVQREDLLGRIGFYKGIVIDHSLSNPVETGFREVLQRQAPGTGAGAQQNAVANPLYRKPNFSGYYENYYSSSESLHQVQKNGVVDIKSSLNVVGGKAVSVGVGISGAYYDAQGSTDAAIKKKLYITANFLLPKVELSFDDSRPCASAEFEAACEQALSADTEKGRFTALVSILGKFGQFVATQTLVGGRLFATDVKEFTGNESESDVASRYAGRLKVSAESVTASFDSDTSVERSKETNSRGNDKDEKQSHTIQAVGGEGAVVENAGQWAESLYDYRRWSAVQREKLIPSIDVLSKDLSLRAWNTLKAFAAKNSAMQLIEEYKVYFLFYGDYDVKVGRLTRSDIVIFKNNNSQHYLAMVGETPQNGGVTGKPFDWAYQFLWRVTPNGNIVSAIPVNTGFPGHEKTVDFALTVLGGLTDKDGKPPETLEVGLRELGSAKYQTWEFTGRGELRNPAFGSAYALAMPLDDKPVLKRVQGDNDKPTFWSTQRAMPADMEKIEARQVFGKLRHPSGLVLAIDGYEDNTRSFVLSDRRRVLLQPENGGKHQLWHLRSDDGVIVSALSISSNSASTPGDVYLAQLADKSIAALAQDANAKTFKTDGKGLACTADDANQPMYLSAAVDADISGQRVEPVLDERGALTFELLPAGTRPITYSVGLTTQTSAQCERMKTVDKRELKVDGYLTGIEFILEERGKGRISLNEYSRMRMRISVMRENGADTVERKDESDKDAVDRDFLCDEDGACDVDVDGRFLLLPEDPIYSIRLRIHVSPSAKRRLAFEYQKVENGPWIGLSDDNQGAKRLDVKDIAVGYGLDAETRNGTKVLGVALAYDSSAQLLRPKLLRRLIG